MVYLAIIALLGGIACGMTGLDENVIVSWIPPKIDPTTIPRGITKILI